MTNISFKANLIVHNNLYKQMPKGYTDNLVAGYKKFLDHKVVKAITEDDTIELYRDDNNRGFGLGIKYINKTANRTINSGIYTTQKVPTVTVGSLIDDTMTYIIEKSGISKKVSETIPKAFIRAAKELLTQKT